MSAPMSAAGSSSRSAAISAPHAADYRAASAALGEARGHRNHAWRAVAKERLEALAGRADTCGQGPVDAAPAGARKVALIIGNGAYKNVRRWPIRRATPS